MFESQQQPLAERFRPSSLEEFLGQQHLIGEKGFLKQALDKGIIPSMILWGPPGTGKTTLANIIAHQTDAHFDTLSAISSGVKDVRQVIDQARKRGGKNILFIDEIHRFSKAQQDALLGAVEKGWITLIGATTDNPSFEVISPLLSRCQVYTLTALSEEALKQLLHRALENDDVLKKKTVEIKEYDALMNLAGGDARKLLNLLELAVNASEKDPPEITNELVMEVAQRRTVLYDKEGEQHYDIISAFIKSIRGSDPNAAIYWLARMIEGGEDEKFIARRLVILASEDIGNANPTALVMATNCFQSVTMIGFPEARIILSQVTVYLATSPKSNASYEAINKAQEVVKKQGDPGVPYHLRNAPTKLMKEQGYGAGYQYAHSYESNFVEQEFLPDALSGMKFYEPGDNAREKEIRQNLKNKWGDKYGY